MLVRHDTAKIQRVLSAANLGDLIPELEPGGGKLFLGFDLEADNTK